jgi:hypothetical protein
MKIKTKASNKVIRIHSGNNTLHNILWFNIFFKTSYFYIGDLWLLINNIDLF